MLKVYLDGEYVDADKAAISVYDHAVLYGDGVFEGIRAYDGILFRLEEHIKRLYDNANAIKLDIPLSMGEMSNIVVETVRVNQLRDAYIRLVVTRGKGDLGLDPRKCLKPTVFCIADKITLYPPEMYETGMKVIISSIRRNRGDSIDPQIKSLNYLNNILAKIEANNLGYPEAIFLNQEGYVVECTGDNIFIVKDGILITPPVEAGALVGITRKTAIEIAEEKGIKVQERLFTPYNLYTADECFLTGTAAEAIPVVEVDGRLIGDGKPGPVTKLILSGFKDVIKVKGTRVYE
ncbi:branched-chain-amino-acid transaminase [Calorimonas adulescens]|uniref:Branched-chain-amino-acid aminotransferase n=1 Tax=Calorimonas adulescens TaxID=2606906 RepID=A0A5D8QBC9_9THEO|nr:branched-chain-amino-acid transaminase [Calorimonas adulescens]TZE81821.1 branched-chain-amino-acid transaminase [Calorimonas adulescens]